MTGNYDPLDEGNPPDASKTYPAETWLQVTENQREAMCKTTDSAAQAVLATDTDEEVRSYLAGNPTVSAGILRRLAEDPSAVVRGRVCSNLWIESSTLELLTRDKEASVRQTALLRLRARDAATLRPYECDVNARYSVALADYGKSRIQVIKEIRDVTGLGLRAAMDLTLQRDQIVLESTNFATANYLVERLAGAGAEVSMSSTMAAD